jgi:drug/metabolite transporter (DMT)-like permease
MPDFKGLAHDAAATVREPMSRSEYSMMLGALIVLTVADTVLCSVNLYYYTDVYAQFFNQGTGFVYILVSIPIVLFRRRRQQQLDAAQQGQLQQGLLNQPLRKPGPPLWVLVAIGALNGTGNFFNAIGSPHTRADTQALLQLVGIPIVLGLSWLMLGKRPSLVASVGALLIVAGTAVSAAPSIAPSWFPCGKVRRHFPSILAVYP